LVLKEELGYELRACWESGRSELVFSDNVAFIVRFHYVRLPCYRCVIGEGLYVASRLKSYLISRSATTVYV